MTEELANLEYLTTYADLIDANKRTVFQIKQAVYNGLEGEPIPPSPVFPGAVPPFALVSGCLTLTRNRNRRFKAASGYTPEIGAALGIDSEAPPVPPESVKPTIEVFAAQTSYMFSVVIANRGNSDMWDVMILTPGSAGWTIAKGATGKSTDVTVTPTTPGEPMQLQVRVQLKKSNQNYGLLSDIVYVTVNP